MNEKNMLGPFNTCVCTESIENIQTEYHVNHLQLLTL